MIDTIVITLKQNMFTIIDHTKFSPSTKGLYEDDYYRLGSRSNMVCKQNPTQAELKRGIYKPRLSVTKRINKYHQFEITMKIEFSIPKIIFGNNFEEIEESHFEDAVQLLQNRLKEMGVLVYFKILSNASVSGVHYSKNIPLTDYSTPYTYLEKISKVNINKRLDLNQTDFRNEGHSLKYRANSFEIVFYDKLKDLYKAKDSEKKAEEKDNAIQLNLFERIISKKPFEVLRMEVRLNKKQKLTQVLSKVGMNENPTFRTVFKKEIAQKILLYYIEEIEEGYPLLLNYGSSNPKDFLTQFIIHNPKTGLKKAIQMLGLKSIIQDVGIRGFREITTNNNKSAWYSLNKEIKKLNFPQQESPFLKLRKAIEDFIPLKLVNYEVN